MMLLLERIPIDRTRNVYTRISSGDMNAEVKICNDSNNNR